MRNALVAEKIAEVDNTDSYYIFNPYSGQPTVTVQALAGTYTVSAWTVTDDTLTVADEFIYAEQVFDFERVMNNYNLFAIRTEEIAYAVAARIDRYVINEMLANGTTTYTTPVGGFANSSNVAKIVSDLVGKVMGYADTYKGLFLVIENTDVTGIMQAQMNSGFSYADAALNNGFMTNFGGVDIYVVRTGTYVSATDGTKTWTNVGKRMFGVKNVSTYASPRNIQSEEKSVTLKTGREIVVWGYVGVKVWTQKAPLIVVITLA